MKYLSPLKSHQSVIFVSAEQGMDFLKFVGAVPEKQTEEPPA
jgi:hypothetical protein